MKVAAFNCSPHKDGNTARMLRAVLDVLESEGIETEFIQVGGRLLQGCTACAPASGTRISDALSRRRGMSSRRR